MPNIRRIARSLSALGVTLAWVSCGGVSEPELPPELRFSETTLDLGTAHEGQVEIRNSGGQTVGPVVLVAGGVQDRDGSFAQGAHITTDPGEVPTLNPGDAKRIRLGLNEQASLQPGEYDAVLTARGGDGVSAQVTVRFTVISAEAAAAASLTLSVPSVEVRQGDVVAVAAEVRDVDGELVQGAPIQWSLSSPSAGYVGPTGWFVGYAPGPLTITARVGAVSADVVVNVSERGLQGSSSVVGRARVESRYTSDLWLHGTVAYSGTWGSRQVGSTFWPGNRLNVWDVSDPTTPSLASVVSIDARTVNDVKVRADGQLAIITHEGSEDGLNGITILDLADPLDPTVVGRFTDELQSGVHNAWIEGDYAYLVVDGTGNGLRILDISDPANPTVVSRFWAGESFLHDVYVRDGLAFLSHWNAGLVILDVGNGIAGGSPENPVEVSRLPDLQGQTHNAWYWPEGGYVFVGEEDFQSPGMMHVINVQNLREPRAAATYRVQGQPPHNFWLDESTATLYLAWYGQGLRAVDVSGNLYHRLDLQGRDIVSDLYNGGLGTCDRSTTFTCTWAPQLHNGLLWVSDMNEGLVALQPPR